jgi:hypothetical protein
MDMIGKINPPSSKGHQCILAICCRSKPAGEQQQATRGAGRLPGLLVGPGPSVNGPRSGTRSGLESLGVPPNPIPDQDGVIY